MSRKYLVPIVLPADPVAALEAATKQYVDGLAGATALDAKYVNVTGDTMTGVLTLASATSGLVAPSVQGNHAAGNNALLVGGKNWLPYADGANYLDAGFHVFRDLAGTSSFLSVANPSTFHVPVSINNPVTGTANLTLKRKAGQTADMLYTLNESAVAMPLAITADARLKLGLISLGDNGMNGMIFRGLQDGAKNTLQFTDTAVNAGYTLAVDHTAGWMTFHSASNLYLDGNAVYFRTATYAQLARFDGVGAEYFVPVVLPANPTLALQAAPKQYVDARPGYNWVQEATPTATLAGQRWWYSTTGIGFVALDRGDGVLVWVQDAP